MPKPWYHSSPAPEKQLDALSIYKKPKRVVRTQKQAEAVLLDAGFTPKQVEALRDAGAIKP